LEVRFRLMSKSGEAPPAGRGDLEGAVIPVHKAKTFDLGRGGIAILTKRRLENGRYVEMNFFLHPFEWHIKALTRVVWVKKEKKKGVSFTKAGLQFLAVQDEDAEKIADYVNGVIKTRKKR